LIPFTRNDDFQTAKKRGRVGNRSSLFFRHQGIYGYTRDLLLRFVRWKASPLEGAESLEQLRALENGVRIKVVVTGCGSPGVDTPEDARTIERLIVSAGKRSPRQRR
jgi:CMP-2-keto-3-deoxyoctulosonic acid synthetase